MSTTEPFMPHPERDETIAAADPGTGGPQPAPGFGVDGEGPDRPDTAEESRAAQTSPAAALADDDVPFRTPDPQDVRRTP